MLIEKKLTKLNNRKEKKMNEDKELKNFTDINKDIKEISDLIIQRYNIKNHCFHTEIETWLSMRITTLSNKVSDKIKDYNKNIYIKARRK